MLLQSSRNAERLTKEAGVRLLGRALTGGLGTAGKLIRKHPLLSAGLVGGTAGGVVFGKDVVQRARRGLSPEYMAYRRQTGYTAPKLPQLAPSGGPIQRRVPVGRWARQIPY